MGYDLNRFDVTVDEELICSICSEVLEDPLQVPKCEHAFCSPCIKQWLQQNSTCPVDRIQVTVKQLKQAPRILRNLLSRLEVACDFASAGCTTRPKLDVLRDHITVCDFNPKKPVECQECGVTVPKDELKEHNCIRCLRDKVCQQNETITDMSNRLSTMNKEIILLRESMSAIRVGNPSSVPSVIETMDFDDIERWVSLLSRAKVTRWGGMISTPDSALQESVRKALIDSLCPQNVVYELMENSHERRWPPGLSTLEIRQMNRRIYENYICRKIPGKQAVVVMACDNPHVAEDMILEPGLVMIFAHGIE